MAPPGPTLAKPRADSDSKLPRGNDETGGGELKRGLLLRFSSHAAKQGGGWKRKFFAADAEKLAEFANEEDVRAFAAGGLIVNGAPRTYAYADLSEVRSCPERGNDAFQANYKNRILLFRASSAQDMNEWTQVLQRGVRSVNGASASTVLPASPSSLLARRAVGLEKLSLSGDSHRAPFDSRENSPSAISPRRSNTVGGGGGSYDNNHNDDAEDSDDHRQLNRLAAGSYSSSSSEYDPEGEEDEEDGEEVEDAGDDTLSAMDGSEEEGALGDHHARTLTSISEENTEDDRKPSSMRTAMDGEEDEEERMSDALGGRGDAEEASIRTPWAAVIRSLLPGRGQYATVNNNNDSKPRTTPATPVSEVTTTVPSSSSSAQTASSAPSPTETTPTKEIATASVSSSGPHELTTQSFFEYDVVEIFENQRWMPVTKWGIKMLLHDRGIFTDRAGHSRTDWYRASLQEDGESETARTATSGLEDREETPDAQVHVIKHPWEWVSKWVLEPLPGLNPPPVLPLATNTRASPHLVLSQSSSTNTANASASSQLSSSSGGGAPVAPPPSSLNLGGRGNGQVSHAARGTSKGGEDSVSEGEEEAASIVSNSTAPMSAVASVAASFSKQKKKLKQRFSLSSSTSSTATPIVPTVSDPSSTAANGNNNNTLNISTNSRALGQRLEQHDTESTTAVSSTPAGDYDGWAYGFDFPDFDYSIARGVARPRDRGINVTVRTRRWVRIRKRRVEVTAHLPVYRDPPGIPREVVIPLLSFGHQVVIQGYLGKKMRSGRWNIRYVKLVRLCRGMWDGGMHRGPVTQLPLGFLLVSCDSKERQGVKVRSLTLPFGCWARLANGALASLALDDKHAVEAAMDASHVTNRFHAPSFSSAALTSQQHHSQLYVNEASVHSFVSSGETSTTPAEPRAGRFEVVWGSRRGAGGPSSVNNNNNNVPAEATSPMLGASHVNGGATGASEPLASSSSSSARVLLFTADSKREAELWVAAINKASEEMTAAALQTNASQGLTSPTNATLPPTPRRKLGFLPGRMKSRKFSSAAEGGGGGASAALAGVGGTAAHAAAGHGGVGLIPDTGESPVRCEAAMPESLDAEGKLAEFVNVEIPITTRTFFQLFLGERAVFQERDFHLRSGDLDVTVSAWSALPSGRARHALVHDVEGWETAPERMVEFRTHTGAPIGPSTTRVKKRQRYYYFQERDTLVVNMWAHSLDVPYGDAFEIVERWIVEPVGGSRVRFRILSDVHFTRSIMLKGTIQRSVTAGSHKNFGAWKRHVLDSVAQALARGGAGGGDAGGIEALVANGEAEEGGGAGNNESSGGIFSIISPYSWFARVRSLLGGTTRATSRPPTTTTTSSKAHSPETNSSSLGGWVVGLLRTVFGWLHLLMTFCIVAATLGAVVWWMMRILENQERIAEELARLNSLLGEEKAARRARRMATKRIFVGEMEEEGMEEE